METETKLIQCCGCGTMVPDEPGSGHRYLESAPACWRIFGEVLAREYTDSKYYAVHRLSVDAWAVQHPGHESAQTIQSAAVHLVRLCMVIERAWPLERANTVMLTFSKRDKSKMRWLTPPVSMGTVSVLDVAKATDSASHCDVVWKWATATWNAWSQHHLQIHEWINQYL